MAEHTPIPWTVKPNDGVILHKGDARCLVMRDAAWVAIVRTEEDAELIRQACNAHQALLEACRDLLDLDTHADPDEAARVFAQARAAIASPKGEPMTSRWNVWLRSKPGFYEQYSGKVTVWAESRESAIAAAFRDLKRGAFPDRGPSMWHVEKVEPA